jgi:hypothetical protein
MKFIYPILNHISKVIEKNKLYTSKLKNQSS